MLISATPVRPSANPTTTARTDSDRDGDAVSTAPITTHAVPNPSTTHHRRRRATSNWVLVNVISAVSWLATKP